MIDGCLHARRRVNSPQAHSNAPDRVLLVMRVHVRVHAGAGGRSRCAHLPICEGGRGVRVRAERRWCHSLNLIHHAHTMHAGTLS